MIYKSYKEIPTRYRKVILDETQEQRVSSVPLDECNEIIAAYQEYEQENETLKNFEIISYINGREESCKYDNAELALVALDRVIGFDDEKKDVIAVFKQAGKIVRAYIKGKYFEYETDSIYL